MSILAMKHYETLSTKFGAENAETIANFVEEKINEKEIIMESKLLNKLDNLMTKQDGLLLKEDIAAFKVDIAEFKADLFKWTLTWFTAALAILAAIALFKN